MRKLATLAVAAAALALSVASSAAQSVGVEVYAGPGGYAYDDDPGYTVRYRSGPRVYGYTRYYGDADDSSTYPDPVAHGGGCGTYRYWNGETCVDARYKGTRD